VLSFYCCCGVVSGVDAGGATGEVEFVPDPMPDPIPGPPMLDPPTGVLVLLAGVPMFPVLPDCVLISVSGSYTNSHSLKWLFFL